MDEMEPDPIGPANRRSVIGIIVACSMAGLLYKLLRHEHLGHSAALFIGLPAVLAILLALTPRTKSVTGAAIKGITLMLLVVAPLLGEGFICILMAAPIFYLVGIIVGLWVDRDRRKRNVTLHCVALLLLPMSLEGVLPQFSFDRSQTVEATRIVGAPVDAVEKSLTQSLHPNTALPAFLRIGFPHPVAAWGQGLRVGDTRTVRFSGAEGKPPGDVVVRVTERREGYVVFETVSDGSKLADWLRWRRSEMEWTAVDAGHTRVTSRIHFERQLDPAWYFTPWERAAVQMAAGYLIDANAGGVGAGK